MAQFESIEPTSLLMKIRNGEVPSSDSDILAASNFAYFLRFKIEGLFEQYQRNSSGNLSRISERQKLAEIVLTGLQITLEQQAEALETYIHPPGPTVSN